MANANYNDIFTTTLENRSGKIADAVSKNNALLNRLREKGHNRLVYGGSKILEELEYGEGDMSWYSGYDRSNILRNSCLPRPNTVLSCVRFRWPFPARIC